MFRQFFFSGTILSFYLLMQMTTPCNVSWCGKMTPTNKCEIFTFRSCFHLPKQIVCDPVFMLFSLRHDVILTK